MTSYLRKFLVVFTLSLVIISSYGQVDDSNFLVDIQAKLRAVNNGR